MPFFSFPNFLGTQNNYFFNVQNYWCQRWDGHSKTYTISTSYLQQITKCPSPLIRQNMDVNAKAWIKRNFDKNKESESVLGLTRKKESLGCVLPNIWTLLTIEVNQKEKEVMLWKILKQSNKDISISNTKTKKL